MEILKSVIYYIKYYSDSIYADLLLKIRKDNYFLTEEKYQHIRRCAKYAYPDEELDYNECETMEDYLEKIFCKKGKVYVLTGDDWYFILLREITHVVVYDFASATKKCGDIFRIYCDLINLFRGKKAFVLSREITSYPLIIGFEKRGDYKIIKDERIFRNGEYCHKILLKVFRKNRKK